MGPQLWMLLPTEFCEKGGQVLETPLTPPPPWLQQMQELIFHLSLNSRKGDQGLPGLKPTMSLAFAGRVEPGIERVGHMIGGFLGIEWGWRHHGFCSTPHFPEASTQASGSSVRQCLLAVRESHQPRVGRWISTAKAPQSFRCADAGEKHWCKCFHHNCSQTWFLLRIV